MRTLFRIWLTLTIISMVFYLPFYVFSNNAINAVEELTPDEIIPFTGIRGQDPERVHNLLARTGIDMSMELEDALEDNKSLSSVKFEYLQTPEATRVEQATGLKLVEASADVGNGRQLKLVFTVIPKRFLRSTAQVNGLLALQITDGNHTLTMNDGPNDELHLWALFEKSGKAARESVQRMNSRFDVMVAEIDAREKARNAPAAVTPSAPVRQFASNTVAGNPGTDQVIIFQFDGKPAYCADEGADGANCHGDSAAFIGQGSYKDYMDPDSSLCIAGENDCTLPQFFPADIRG